MTASPQILRSVWANVRATCKRLDVDVAALAAELERLDELSRGAVVLPSFDPAEVGSALVEAGQNGTDPLDDPRVIRAAVARTLADYGSGAVSSWADARRVDLLTEATPGLLAALSERVDKAQKVITSARSKGVPPEALAGRDYALRAALETPAALARDAVADAEAAVSAWRTLAGAVGLASVGVHETAILAADLPAAVLEGMSKDERRTVTAAAVAGYPLALPADPAQLAARRRRLRDERDALSQVRAEQARNAPNRHRGAPAVVTG